jgi:hypothetical protein
MARNTNAAVLEKLRKTKYTTEATSHNVGDRTSSANRKLSGSASEAHEPLFVAGMSSVRTLEKHRMRKEVAPDFWDVP